MKHLILLLSFTVFLSGCSVPFFDDFGVTDTEPDELEVVEFESPHLGADPAEADLLLIGYTNYHRITENTMHASLVRILPEYPTVSVVFKQAPINFKPRVENIYDPSELEDAYFKASEAVLCANDQGYFAQFHERLVNRPMWQYLTESDLDRMASTLRIVYRGQRFEKEIYDECMQTRKYKGAVIEENTQVAIEHEWKRFDTDIDVYRNGEFVKRLMSNVSYGSDEKTDESNRKLLDALLFPEEKLTDEEREELRVDALLNQTCPEDPEELRQESWFQSAPVDYSDTYEIREGCLYFKGERVFLKSLYSSVLSGEFGQNYGFRLHYDPEEDIKSFGEDLHEWFRFSENGKLFIYLVSGAGCDFCAFNGPYLEIDERTGLIEFKSSDLPKLFHLHLSPDNKRAIEFDTFGIFYAEEGEQPADEVLYLYDFTQKKRIREVYRVPDEFTLVTCGLGCWPTEESLRWINGKQLQIHLIQTDEKGAARFNTIDLERGRTQDEYIYEGEAFIIEVP